MPERIQRLRASGWRMPAEAAYVGRPSRFGNPFRAYKCDCCGYWDVKDDNGVTYLVNHEYVRRPEVRADPTTWTTQRYAAAEAVRLYDAELTCWVGGRMNYDPKLDQPCHADILLTLANQTTKETT